MGQAKPSLAEVLTEGILVPEIPAHVPLTERQVRDLIAAGKLRAYKVGGRVRVMPADLDQLVKPVQPTSKAS